MMFRYNVECYDDTFTGSFYYVTIQRYRDKFPHWRTVAKDRLINILHDIDDNAFSNYKYKSMVKYTDLLNEIQKYNSIENIIIKYIMNVVIKQEKEIDEDMLIKETVDKLILTNGWKTIEVKENDK